MSQSTSTVAVASSPSASSASSHLLLLSDLSDATPQAQQRVTTMEEAMNEIDAEVETIDLNESNERQNESESQQQQQQTQRSPDASRNSQSTMASPTRATSELNRSSRLHPPAASSSFAASSSAYSNSPSIAPLPSSSEYLDETSWNEGGDIGLDEEFRMSMMQVADLQGEFQHELDDLHGGADELYASSYTIQRSPASSQYDRSTARAPPSQQRRRASEIGDEDEHHTYSHEAHFTTSFARSAAHEYEPHRSQHDGMRRSRGQYTPNESDHSLRQSNGHSSQRTSQELLRESGEYNATPQQRRSHPQIESQQPHRQPPSRSRLNYDDEFDEFRVSDERQHRRDADTSSSHNPTTKPDSPPLPAHARRHATRTSAPLISGGPSTASLLPESPYRPHASSASPDVQALRAQIDKLILDATRASAREAALTRDVTAKEKQIQAEREKSEAMKSQLITASDRAHELSTQLNSVRAQVRASEERATSSSEQFVRMKEAWTDVTLQLKSEKDRLIRANWIIQQLSKQLAALTHSTPERVLDSLDVSGAVPSASRSDFLPQQHHQQQPTSSSSNRTHTQPKSDATPKPATRNQQRIDEQDERERGTTNSRQTNGVTRNLWMHQSDHVSRQLQNAPHPRDSRIPDRHRPSRQYNLHQDEQFEDQGRDVYEQEEGYEVEEEEVDDRSDERSYPDRRNGDERFSHDAHHQRSPPDQRHNRDYRLQNSTREYNPRHFSEHSTNTNHRLNGSRDTVESNPNSQIERALDFDSWREKQRQLENEREKDQDHEVRTVHSSIPSHTHSSLHSSPDFHRVSQRPTSASPATNFTAASFTVHASSPAVQSSPIRPPYATSDLHSHSMNELALSQLEHQLDDLLQKKQKLEVSILRASRPGVEFDISLLPASNLNGTGARSRRAMIQEGSLVLVQLEKDIHSVKNRIRKIQAEKEGR